MNIQKIVLKTEDGDLLVIEGEVYREHWFVHASVLKPGSEKEFKGMLSLSHIKTGLCVKSSYSEDGLKRFADIIIDDIGVDGSFKNINDLSGKQKRDIAHLRSVSDYTNYVGTIIH